MTIATTATSTQFVNVMFYSKAHMSSSWRILRTMPLMETAAPDSQLRVVIEYYRENLRLEIMQSSGWKTIEELRTC